MPAASVMSLAPPGWTCPQTNYDHSGSFWTSQTPTTKTSIPIILGLRASIVADCVVSIPLYNPCMIVGYCPHPVTVHIGGPIKGYI